MKQRRGRLLKAMEESVVIRRTNSQRRAGEPEFLTPMGADNVMAVILPQRFNPDVAATTTDEIRYVCNLVPPIPDIRPTDELVRRSGQPREEVLTITETTSVQGVQQLILTTNRRVR